MASTLTVDNIVGATNASSIHIPGHVIQTVHTSYNTSVTLNHSSGAIETGLNHTITPKYSNSKILITVTQNIQTSSNSYCQICIRRGTIASNSLLSIIVTPEGYNNSTDEEINQLPFSWLDSPATTSATRYFVSMERIGGTSNITAQTSTNGVSVSTMVLQEIAQ